jgi:AcrR family transcriptional regulator
MANYKNGIDTRNKLYASAKKLFCENGYSDTTVNDIISQAKSKLGLFTYYFESKEAVATDILKDYIDDVMNNLEILGHRLYPSNDALFIDMIEYRSFFKCTSTSPNASRFYTDLSATQAFIKKSAEVREFYFNRIADKCRYINSGSVLGIEFPDIAVSLSTGMDVQLCRDLCCKRLKTRFDEAVDCYFRQYYRFICNDTELINKNISLSRKLVSSLKFTVGESFKVTIE